jgi:hypothetical protein
MVVVVLFFYLVKKKEKRRNGLRVGWREAAKLVVMVVVVVVKVEAASREREVGVTARREKIYNPVSAQLQPHGRFTHVPRRRRLLL